MDMERRLAQPDASFDLPVDVDDEDNTFSPAAYLTGPENTDPSVHVENVDHKDFQETKLSNALATLDERSQDILRQRWLNDEGKATLHTLADHYQVSAERIRQIENNALKKLKHLMA